MTPREIELLDDKREISTLTKRLDSMIEAVSGKRLTYAGLTA
jgi:hypothetical protein